MRVRPPTIRPAKGVLCHPGREGVFEFFDPMTGAGGFIQLARTDSDNLAFTVYRHTDRVLVGEGRRES